MKGNGRVILSKENLLDAMQKWLDERWTDNSPVVTDVELEWAGSDRVVVMTVQSNKSFMGVKEE